MSYTLYRKLFESAFLCVSLMFPLTTMADTSIAKIGIVIMHGKGGSPAKNVTDLAASLNEQGYLVNNLEMSWSGKRDYDVSVSAAENEVEAALNSLRAKGATKLFVAGHSQGGLFALYFGNKHVVDGVIAMAPGGNVGSNTFIKKLGEYVERARKLVEEGKGEDKTSLADFEGSKGVYSIVTTPSVYLSWFEPEGAMNELSAINNMNPATPVLFIVPTNDYPPLLKIKQQMFESLPVNPRTKLYEPDSNHLNAPSASLSEIVAWTNTIANVQPRN